MTTSGKKVQLRVSPEVARIVKAGAPRELQLQAARGELLEGIDGLNALLFLCQGLDRELKALALATVRKMPAGELLPTLRQRDLHYQLLDFIARVRAQDTEVLNVLLGHPAVAEKTLLFLARKGPAEVLDLLRQKVPSVRTNPIFQEAFAENPSTVQEDSAQESFEEGEEEENKSKYQLALEMRVADKIETALKGDKEWRGLLIKDANKLVSSAVLKNPRITEGEILALAKNKAATDDQIRLITLNKEWVKNYQIKLALVLHPRTPLPKALRYMGVLTEKDLKALAKSRGVSQVIVNQARRMLVQKQNKR